MLPSDGCGRFGDDFAVSSFTVPRTSNNQFVTDQELAANDVLFGRGASIINYVGNVRFRDLVQTRKFEYNAAVCHQIKGEVANEIYREIIDVRNGRFLQRIHSREEAAKLGVPEGADAWKLAADGVILEKIKQTLRDKTPQKPKLMPTSSMMYPSHSNFGGIESTMSEKGGFNAGKQYETSLLTQLLMQQQENNRQSLIHGIQSQIQQQEQILEAQAFMRKQQKMAELAYPGLRELSMTNSDFSGMSGNDAALMAASLNATSAAALAASTLATGLGLRQQQQNQQYPSRGDQDSLFATASNNLAYNPHNAGQSTLSALQNEVQRNQLAAMSTISSSNIPLNTKPNELSLLMSLIGKSQTDAGNTTTLSGEARANMMHAARPKRASSSESETSKGSLSSDRKPKARKLK